MSTKRTHGNRQKTLALSQLERLKNIGKDVKRSQDRRGEVKTTERISNRLSFHNTPRRLLLRLFQLLNRCQLLREQFLLLLTQDTQLFTQSKLTQQESPTLLIETRTFLNQQQLLCTQLSIFSTSFIQLLLQR